MTRYLSPCRRLSPREQAALIDEAKARALQLREKAVRDFWCTVARGVHRVIQATRQRSMLRSRLGPPTRVEP